MTIERAREADVPALLALQKLAFRTEAAIYQDDSIPPLTETEDAYRGELERVVVLKAVAGGELVGAVRGWCRDGTCHVGRLAVHPDHRRRGIGTALMIAIESVFADAVRFELFTGDRSESNLLLYRGLGYTELRREPGDSVTFVFLEKVR